MFFLVALILQCSTFTVSGYFNSPGSCLLNVASVTSAAGTTWKDSVCVSVVNVCANTDTVFVDSTYSGKKVISNKSIFVAGRYYVNDSLTLNNCSVYTAAGAQIITQSGGTLNLNNTIIQSCDTMWRGINVLANGKAFVNGSTLKDADVGITALHQSQVEILQSEIYDCVTGLLIPQRPTGGYNTIALKVDGSRFKMQAVNFKPDYTGQAAHGAIPKAGIDITNWIGTIGLTNLNEFEKLNTGIVAKSSILSVKRSQFKNIQFDTFYTEAYRGTAMISVGVPAGDIYTGSLTVLPEATAYNTVDNCFRGIYTDKSVLTANYVHLLNVTQGVYGINTPTLQTTMVSNCTITSTGTGIFWVNNPLARAMMATGNTITINAPAATGYGKRMSRGAIYAGETAFFKPVVYTANSNTITLNNAWYGIMSNATLNSKIKDNVIQINQSSGNADVTGIEINSNVNSNASCNTILGDYTGGSTGITSAIYTTQSTRTNISCNVVDYTYRGIYFGGVSPSSILPGNEMNNHFNGLFLNNQAVISQQPHRGNIWKGPFTSFGAMIMAPFQLVNASTFYVDSSLTSDYKPTVNDTSWFKTGSGSTFYCWQHPTLCNNNPPALLSLDSLEVMIANGSLELEEYADETRAITQEYLYRILADDSTLIQNDSTYVAFMMANMGEPVSYLYDAEEYLRAAYEYEPVFIDLIDSCNYQITLLSDSINCITEGGCEGDIEALNYQIEFLNQTINNLYIQREATLNNNLDEAELQNEYVVNAETPELNTAYMNDIEINFLERGEDIQYIIDNYEGILAVAQQCPYAGGHAVIRARVWLSMLTDSIDYNDNAVCLQSGIYRMAHDTTVSQKGNDEIIIQPNPAGDYITVTAKSENAENCKIKIINNLNQTVLSKQLNCNNQERIDVSKINQGLYAVQIILNNELIKVQKLIIQR